MSKFEAVNKIKKNLGYVFTYSKKDYIVLFF